MGVSIRLKVGKFEVATDTPEEAAKIMTLFDPGLVSDAHESKVPRVLGTEWTPQLLEAFHELIKEQPLQRRLLNVLSAAGEEGKLKEDLVKDLKLSAPKQLAGPLSGLAKYAQKLGLAREAVYSMSKLQLNGKRTYQYWANLEFWDWGRTQLEMTSLDELSNQFPEPVRWSDPHKKFEAPCPFCQKIIPWAQFPSGIKVAGHGCGHTSEEIVAAVRREHTVNSETQKPNRPTDPALRRDALK